MNITRRLGLAAMVLSAAMVPSNLLGAEANDYWDITFNNSTGTGVSGWWTDDGGNVKSYNSLAGYFTVTANEKYEKDGVSFNSGRFYTFCTDIGVYMFTGNESSTDPGWDYDPVSFLGQDGVKPTWRTGGVYDAAYIYNKLINAFVAPPGLGQWGSVDKLDSTTEYAATQLAIWEVLYDSPGTSGSWDITSGRFGANVSKTSGLYLESMAILNQLTADIAANGGTLPTLFSTTWLRPMFNDGSEGGSQGLLYPPVAWTPVPDGGLTLAMLGLALGGLAAMGGRGFRKQ